MSRNLDTKLHVFTDKQLEERDLKIIKTTAKIVNKAITKHVAKEMVGKNSGQQVRALRDNCKDLLLDDKTLDIVSENIFKAINKK